MLAWKNARATLTQPAEGGEVCNVKSSAELIRPGKVDAWVANHYTTPPASQEHAQQPVCECGDRPADQCTEQWGPECDLGNNEAYVKVAQQPSTQAWANETGLRQIECPSCGDLAVAYDPQQPTICTLEAKIQKLNEVMDIAKAALEKSLGAWMGTCAWHRDVRSAISSINTYYDT